MRPGLRLGLVGLLLVAAAAIAWARLAAKADAEPAGGLGHFVLAMAIAALGAVGIVLLVAALAARVEPRSAAGAAMLRGGAVGAWLGMGVAAIAQATGPLNVGHVIVALALAPTLLVLDPSWGLVVGGVLGALLGALAAAARRRWRG